MAQGAKTVFVSIGTTPIFQERRPTSKHCEAHYTRRPLSLYLTLSGGEVPVQFFLGASRHIVAQVL